MRFYQTPAKFNALKTLNKAMPLFKNGMIKIATSELDKSINIYSRTAKSMQQLASSSALLKGVKWVPWLDKAFKVLDSVSYVSGAPQGSGAQATVAMAVDQTGSASSTAVAAWGGAELGLACGPAAWACSPVGALAGAFGGGWAWNHWVSEPLRTWGYQQPQPVQPLTPQEIYFLNHQVVDHRP